MNIRRINKKQGLSPAYLAVGAAVLFGGSTPVSKLLIVHIHPQLLATYRPLGVPTHL